MPFFYRDTLYLHLHLHSHLHLQLYLRLYWPRPQGSGGSSPEQKEDNNLGQVRRPFGLSKEGLGAKGGEEEGGQNWRIQSNFL